MNKDIESIFNNAKRVALSPHEKSRILQDITDATPIGETVPDVRNTEALRLYETEGVSPFAHYYSRLNLSRSRATALVAVVVVLLGITGTNAQNALPGDILYPMKIHVNEKLAYVGAHTPEAQAILEVTFATRRLEEARDLLYNNKLTVRASEQLAVGFSTYSEKLAQHIEDLTENGEKEDAEAINMKFVASLTAHREVLGVLAASSSVSERLLRSLDMSAKASATTSVPAPTKLGEPISVQLIPSPHGGGLQLRFPGTTTDEQDAQAHRTLKLLPKASSTPNGSEPNIQGTSSTYLELKVKTLSPSSGIKSKTDTAVDF